MTRTSMSITTIIMRTASSATATIMTMNTTMTRTSMSIIITIMRTARNVTATIMTIITIIMLTRYSQAGVQKQQRSLPWMR